MLIYYFDNTRGATLLLPMDNQPCPPAVGTRLVIRNAKSISAYTVREVVMYAPSPDATVQHAFVLCVPNQNTPPQQLRSDLDGWINAAAAAHKKGRQQ